MVHQTVRPAAGNTIAIDISQQKNQNKVDSVKKMLSKAGCVIYKTHLKTTGNSSDLLNPPHRSLEEELNIHTKALGRFSKVYISLNNSGK